MLFVCYEVEIYTSEDQEIHKYWCDCDKTGVFVLIMDSMISTAVRSLYKKPAQRNSHTRVKYKS